MNNIYVLDRNFNLLGVIDEYVSTIWRPSYYEVGDFEIYLGTTEAAVKLLKENNYVVRSSDISIDESGNVIYKKVMVIKHIQLITNIETGDFMTVTGYELKHLLHQRIVWQQTILTGTAENAIRRLITENAIAPTIPNRVIPNLILDTPLNLTDTIKKQVTADPLDEAIINICTSYNYGWEIYIFNNQLKVKIYEGLNRSYTQTERPYVIFSESFENLHNTDYQLTIEGYANTALIGGEGEGLDRIYTPLNNDNTGLDRYETFIDANGVSRNAGSENEITLEEYLLLLQEKGKDGLAELSYTEGFTGEVLSDVAFKYGLDFNLGDVVTVINKYGITKDVRVLSAIESEDETGTKLIPQFNI